MMDKVHVYTCFYIASIKSTAGNKTKFFPNPLLISTSRFLILAEAFRYDHVAACSTALRSATVKNEMGGYVTVPCSSKMTQRSSTAQRIIGFNSSDVTRLLRTEDIRNTYSLLKSPSVIIAALDNANLFTPSILI